MFDLDDMRVEVLSSLLGFTKVFYSLRTGREFVISNPVGRESHHITISRALTRVLKGECKRLIIKVPPRYGKTELAIHFIASAMAQYPDANFLYASYGKKLAKRQTQTIRSIMSLPAYRKLFGVEILDDDSATDDFATNFGGRVYAAGARGPITGFGAGIKNCTRFGGCIFMDDMHKPDEAASDTIREGVIDWYSNTLMSRTNSPDTPIIFIGQCVHEADLGMYLEKSGDWEVISLPALDVAGNALDPAMHDVPMLKKMQDDTPYVFAAQYQQSPHPAGGGIFKPEYFHLTDEDPNSIFATFLTVDTAASEKTYADSTVFSFWGVYRTLETGDLAIHCIACLELKIDPSQLQSEFMDFYSGCNRYRIKPKLAAIEAASTGLTLISCMNKIQGFSIKDINRQRDSAKNVYGRGIPNSKVDRFLSIQNFVAKGLVSLTRHARHTSFFIEHCRKITANDSHAHDDIADTMYDAVKLALIDEYFVPGHDYQNSQDVLASNLMHQRQNIRLQQTRRDSEWRL